MGQRHAAGKRSSTHVMVIGGGPSVLARIEPMMPAGAYDVEFVDFDQEPYGCITDDTPDLLVVCLRLDNPMGFQFLNALQYDPVTRRIPVLTYSTEAEGQHLPGVDDARPKPLRAARIAPRLARH